MNARCMVGCAAALVVTLSPARAGGQLARLRGRVFDSVTALPLAGARVELVNADDRARIVVSTTSDSLGLFVMDSIARGRYIAGFLHPMLDSLGLVFAQRFLTVADNGDVRFELAVPSPERIENALCGAPSEKDVTGAVLGFVLNAHTFAPMENATVMAEWAEFSLGKNGMSHRVMSRTATAVAGGWFAVCGVPTGTSVILRAMSGADTTGPIEIDVPKNRIARRNIYIDHPGETPASVATTDSAPAATPPMPSVAVQPTDSAPRAHRHGTMTGWIRTEDGVPIPGARVSLFGSDAIVSTADDGSFQLTEVAGGTQTLVTRALGFVPDERPVDVTDRHIPVVVGLLAVRRFLDTVHVKASRPNLTSIVGFDERKRAGTGKFFTASDVERLHPQELTDLLRHAPSVDLSTDNAHNVKLRMRGAQGSCTPAIFVDGKQLVYWELADLNSLIQPDQIGGIELYTAPMTPAEFRTKTLCGTIVVWTRSMDRFNNRR
jgi:hypothetical protein